MPKKINYNDKIFEFDELEKVYVTSNFDNSIMQGLDLYIEGLKQDSLNIEVEIIEEQEEIDIQNIKEKNISYVICDNDFESGEVKDILNNFFRENNCYIDTILRAVKQLDNKLKEK